MIPTKKQSQRHRRRRHHFIAAWVRSPLKIGALLPSSRTLARAMAAEVDIDAAGMVIELGAGTGVMTHALLKAGVPPEKLIVVERDRKLHAILRTQFPHLNVLCADAMHLDKMLEEAGVRKVNAIVSSLPLLVMPREVREAIEGQMAQALEVDSVLVQFTYGPKSPIARRQQRKHHIHGRRTRIVMTNVPPAHVWVYRREN